MLGSQVRRRSAVGFVLLWENEVEQILSIWLSNDVSAYMRVPYGWPLPEFRKNSAPHTGQSSQLFS